MKQRDIFALALIAIVAAIGSWIVVSQFIATPANRTAEVEVVAPYDTDFDQAAQTALSSPEAVDFSRDPNLGAAGTDNILQPGTE